MTVTRRITSWSHPDVGGRRSRVVGPPTRSPTRSRSLAVLAEAAKRVRRMVLRSGGPVVARRDAPMTSPFVSLFAGAIVALGGAIVVGCGGASDDGAAAQGAA